MYNHNKAQQSKNKVQISWDILYMIFVVTLAINPKDNCQIFLNHRKYTPWQFYKNYIFFTNHWDNRYLYYNEDIRITKKINNTIFIVIRKTNLNTFRTNIYAVYGGIVPVKWVIKIMHNEWPSLQDTSMNIPDIMDAGTHLDRSFLTINSIEGYLYVFKVWICIFSRYEYQYF